ncbi:MAG: hypothetical protein ABUL50_03765, partial [Rhizobacter sp.]
MKSYTLLIGLAVLAAVLLIASVVYLESTERDTRSAVQATLAARQTKSVQQFHDWLEQRTRQARAWADRP